MNLERSTTHFYSSRVLKIKLCTKLGKFFLINCKDSDTSTHWDGSSINVKYEPYMNNKNAIKYPPY